MAAASDPAPGSGRKPFVHEGRTIYEWDQTLDEVNVYIKPPPGCTAKMIACTISPKRITLGLKGNPAFIDVRLLVRDATANIAVQTLELALVHNTGNRAHLTSKCPVQEELSLSCIAKDSFWMLEDAVLHLSLQKMMKGETWQCVFKGHGTLDPLSESEVHKAMLLQRFGEEHAGFDFSGATVSGAVPDPRTFMGGVKYT